MALTEKRTSFCLTKEDLRILSLMKEKTGETATTIIKKALFYYYINRFENDKKL